ncbi:hypothetical protein Y1Q_0015650 [Alligator mississippiensis]|uniref:Uncharacterized protein n=1 Tax=Alligator mississippiensis TaxID=8496 RepID=A0A151NPJ9_ALLMI|nr:hypothetical protein Y1Q_0015650 [Alligator mississippiensis]
MQATLLLMEEFAAVSETWTIIATMGCWLQGNISRQSRWLLQKIQQIFIATYHATMPLMTSETKCTPHCTLW